MKCPKCSAELNDYAKFCPECGTPVGSAQTNNSGTDQNNHPSDKDNGGISRDGYDSYPAKESRSSYGKKHSRKPQKKSRKKPLIISIVALVLVAAIVTSVILVITRNTVSAKELKEAKENYLPPAQAVVIDTSLSDPSNDKIQFKYDDRARIISCTYKVNDKTYDQRYTYDDTKRTATIDTSYKNHPIFTKEIGYGQVTKLDTFETVDGYFIRLDDSVVSSAAEEPQETATPTEEPTEAPTEEPTEEPTEAPSDWKDLYIDFLNSTDLEYTYGKLLYIDDNDTPELVLANFPPQGGQIFSYHVCWIGSGEVQHDTVINKGFGYKERTGSIQTTYGGASFQAYGGWTRYYFDGSSLSIDSSGKYDRKNNNTEYIVDDEAVSQEAYDEARGDGWEYYSAETKKDALPDYIRNFGS